MFTQEIIGVRRFGLWAKNLFLFLFGSALLWSALFNQPISLPTFGRWLWGLSGAFTLGIALLELRMVWNKKMDLRKDSKFFTLVGSSGMTVIAFSILLVAFLIRDLQNFAILAPMALLVIIIGILISVDNRIQQGELNTREKLLEIEYRLAALDERLQGGKTGKD
jgi:fucose 4-O-acetylase-like acetyltransferase